MKKYLSLVILSIVLMSCSVLSLVGQYNVSNERVKRAIAASVDGSQDYVVVKGSTKVRDVYVQNGKLQVVIDIESSNILSAIFTSSPSTKAVVTLESDIRYADGKLYTKNIRVKNIDGIIGEDQVKQISNALVYTLLDNKEIYDFSKDGISARSIRDVYIGQNNIVVDFK